MSELAGAVCKKLPPMFTVSKAGQCLKAKNKLQAT